MSRELLKQWIESVAATDNPLVYVEDPINHPDVLTVYADLLELPYTGEVFNKGETFKYDIGYSGISSSVPTWDVEDRVLAKSIQKMLIKWKPESTNTAGGHFTFIPQFEWS